MAIIEITADHAGWEFRPPGTYAEAGFANGSHEVPGAAEENSLTSRTVGTMTTNIRQAGISALYDWCHGSDPQWLYQANDDHHVWSHDHGHYFPGGPDSGLNSRSTTRSPPRTITTRRRRVCDPSSPDTIAHTLQTFTMAHGLPILGSAPACAPTITTRSSRPWALRASGRRRVG